MKIRKIFIKSLLPCVMLALIMPVMPSVVYANASTTPVSVSVTYYDGVFTRGFTWWTDRTVTGGCVQIVEKTSGMSKNKVDWSDDSVITVNATHQNHPSGAGGDTSLYYVWKAHYDFTAAAAGKTFFYRVGSPLVTGGWSIVGEQLIDGQNDSVKLLHVTDPQGSNEISFGFWRQTLSAAFQVHKGTQALITSGDFVENGHNVNQWNWALDLPKTTLMNTVMVPSAGNHDVSSDDFFSSHFNVAYPAPQTATRGFYYSFDVSNVHVAVLETATAYNGGAGISAAQLAWLENDLQNTTADWKIVVTHMALVSAGKHAATSTTIALRNQLFPIMAKYKVDLVLQGHDHTYVRSNPYSFDNAHVTGLNNLIISDDFDTVVRKHNGNNRKYMVEPNGTTYVLINTASDKQYTVSSELPSYLSYAISPVNYLQMNIQPDASMFGAITVDNNGLMYESYTVERSTGEVILYDYFGIINDLSKQDGNMNEEEPNPVLPEAPSGCSSKAYVALAVIFLSGVMLIIKRR